MSFPRYPKYKDSGVAWLGEVPAHWEVSPLKYFARVGNGSTPSREQPAYWTGGTYPWLNSSAVNQETITESDQFVTELALSECHLPKIIPPAVLIGITGQGRTRGMASTLMFEATISQHIAYVQPDALKASVGWVRRVIDANYKLLRDESEAGGSTKGAITCEQISALKVPLPPPLEQVAIVAFLDREIAKIDALVAEQQLLIELLEEKRQAVISHTVTKGLNPDAPMKPSGVEWLGEVPTHWEVKKLRFLCDVQTGSRDTEDAVDDGKYPFFVRSQTVERIDTSSFNCEAVLTAGDGVGVGKVFHHYQGAFDFHQRVYMLNNFRGVSGRFLFHFLKENFYKVALEGGAKSTVDSLRRPMFMNFWVCVPPPEEQTRIVMEIDRDAERFDTLAAAAQHAIDLLQERRTALISAAVAGQIDVRGIAERSAA